MAVKTALYRSPYSEGPAQEVSYVDDEILIKFREGVPEEDIATLLDQQGLDKKTDLSGGTAVYATSVDPVELSAQLVDNPIIEIVEPNLVRTTMGAETQRGENAFQNMGLFAVALALGLFIFWRK